MKNHTNTIPPKLNVEFDVVIVGSGPAGVHASYPLVKAGLRVAIIDGGLDSKKFMGEYVSDDDADKELIDSIPVPQELRASPLLPSNPVDSQGRPNPKNYKE